MLKFLPFLCCVWFCVSTQNYVLAMTAEQKAAVHSHFESVGKVCIKDNVITADELKDLRMKKIPTGPMVPCFLACVMKDIGLLDENGVLQKESALDLAKSVFNDPEEIKNIEDYLHSCSSVNAEAVSDGAKGCDRAMLAYKCMIENASQFGFDV